MRIRSVVGAVSPERGMRRCRVRILLGLSWIGWLLTGCSARPAPVDQLPSPFNIQGIEALEEGLREAGLVVEELEHFRVEGVGDGERWLVEGDPLLVMQGAYSSFATSAPDQIGRMESSANVWSTSGLSVTYAGSNGGVRLVLDAMLGDPLGRTASGPNEPYPPAVLAALREVARLHGQSPEDLHVLGFQERLWPDSCLGLATETASADCALVEVTGWEVRIEMNGAIVTARSDALGNKILLDSSAY